MSWPRFRDCSDDRLLHNERSSKVLGDSPVMKPTRAACLNGFSMIPECYHTNDVVQVIRGQH